MKMKLALVILLCLTYTSAQLNVLTDVVTQATNLVTQLAGGLGGLGGLGGVATVIPGDVATVLPVGRSYKKPPKGNVSDTVKIIMGFKYPVEEYSVSTDDGYVLQIFRIPCNSKNPNVVLLMADFYASSDYWVLSGPKYGLPYYLADLGYDVWLGNNRGGKYGQKHKLIKLGDSAFWYYSVHEWGIYDAPAIIDFILDKVGCHKLNYIGWGYGATEFFVMASERPEYMDKIKNMQALGPHVYLYNTRSRIKLASLNVDEESLYEISGRDALIPTPAALLIAGQAICLKQAVNKDVCNYIEPVAHEAFNIDIDGFPEIACENPLIQGSMRFFLHIIQSCRNGFRKYDHGLASNLLYYGRECPPKYNIKAADVPIALYYSNDDNISVDKDVLRLSVEVPKLIRAFQIKSKSFSFVDFPLSKVGPDVFYHWIHEVLKRYNK